MRARLIVLSAAASALVWLDPSLAAASILRVCPSGCTYGSIQAAINAAQTGDTIKVSPGIYTETLLVAAPVAAKSFSLKGSGPKKTIVDGNQQGIVLEVDTNYAVDITDMAFTNGKDLPVGGIFNHGTMKLTNAVVTKNEGVETAGGIANDIDGTLTMSRTTVTDNQSTGPTGGRGGGLFNVGTASVTDSTISRISVLIGGPAPGAVSTGHGLLVLLLQILRD